jgi:hypothetical protein
MKERPIIFSGPMVRAILEGRKTQTRRVFKKMHAGDGWAEQVHPAAESGWIGWWGHTGDAAAFTKKRYKLGIPCPYGVPGDRLWVLEAWLPFDLDHVINGKRFAYKASPYCEESRKAFGYRWCPSIHMPRNVSRITLEITEVRVQRIQNISAEDAIAEGIEWNRCGCEVCAYTSSPCPADASTLIEDFRDLWSSVHKAYGPHGWNANPWVWCVSFKRVDE